MSDSATIARRRAGLLIPLFSCASTAELGHRRHRRHSSRHRLAGRRRQRMLQLLPTQRDGARPAVAVFGDQRDGDRSDLHHAAERAGVRRARRRRRRSTMPIATQLAAVRQRAAVDHASVRALKQTRAPARRSTASSSVEWRRDTARARELRRVRQRAGVVDRGLRAVSRAPRARAASGPGPNGPRRCSGASRPRSIARAASLRDEVLFQQYLQWLADVAVADRARRDTHGVALFGDLPFMVDGDSADVWARQHQFRLDASVGAPPDAFSATGQDWGMPVYRWDVIAAEDFRWLRERARRSADLYDGYRVDHLVGFYRTYGRPRDGGAAVLHAGRRARAARARRAAARSVPPERRRDHRRGSRHRARLRPRVARAARRPRLPRVPLGAPLAHEGQPFRDPLEYPPVSRSRLPARTTPNRWPSGGKPPTKTSGSSVSELPTIQRLTGDAGLLESPYDPTVRDVLARSAVRVGIRSAAAADAGRVRLARSHQRAGDRHRRELDVQAAMALRPFGRGSRGA